VNVNGACTRFDWARRGSNDDRREGAKQMRELAQDLAPGQVSDELNAMADQLGEYVVLITAHTSSRPVRTA